MDLVRGSIVLIVLAMIGCGGGGPAPVAVEPPAQTAGIDAVKSMLQDVAGSGELGSGAEGLRTALEAMKGSDAAKATALLADLDALEASGSPDAAKAKATEMLGKL